MIRLQNVVKIYYGKKAAYRALEFINLTIQKKEFCILQGPSGSGKSTLLNLVGCLDSPTRGTIRIDGTDISTLNDRELSRLRATKIGFIFQNFNLISVLNVWENVCYPFLLNQKQKINKSYVEHLLHKFGLWELRKKRPEELSGGQQQRTAIVRAMVMQPDIILADEPTANLDSVTGKEIMDYMQQINEESDVTFLIATHDPMVASYATRLIQLHDGKIVEEKCYA